LGRLPESGAALYGARGQAENFIKLHKTQLASDRTSCRNPTANQFRLILHTAAYWLLHTLRAAAPAASSWAGAEFTTLRLRLIKIAARVSEGVARIRVRLPSACPDKELFRLLAGRFAVVGP
jgi:Transposase DDE domain group 1